jgi:hypothetical protein
MTKFTCVFRRTTEGRLALSFAADLFKKLDRGPGKTLHIFLEPDLADAARISTEAKAVDQILTDQNSAVLAEAAAGTGLSNAEIEITNQEGDGIIIDHATAFERADLDVLYPSREKTLLARGKGPLLVPFGDSLSAFPAAKIAIDLGKKLALPVVFYHTTWKDQETPSTDPADHMCEGAREVQKLLTDAATKAGIDFSFAIETADDVAEGILHCAMRLSVRLIVMPRSAKTTLGCYVNQALAKTPVPLLAVAANLQRSWLQ